MSADVSQKLQLIVLQVKREACLDVYRQIQRSIPGGGSYRAQNTTIDLMNSTNPTSELAREINFLVDGVHMELNAKNEKIKTLERQVQDLMLQLNRKR